MSPKHTAGPWTACTNHAWGKLADIRTESGDAIAFCQTLIESDARLIAAAPELLTALEDCIAVMTNELCGLSVIQPELAAARAAIAKATGEEEAQ